MHINKKHTQETKSALDIQQLHCMSPFPVLHEDPMTYTDPQLNQDLLPAILGKSVPRIIS